MYRKLPNLVLGFHGCDQKVFDDVIGNKNKLKASCNDYDWLGSGIYFWENSYERAREWAGRHPKIKAPAVVGAIIDLGHCLNLTDYASCELLKAGYELLKSRCESLGQPLPENKTIKGSKDVLLRLLDCAVIEQLHLWTKDNKYPAFDSIRGVFTEGEPIFPGSALLQKTHIQISVVNPNCIKGYFSPLEQDASYNIP